MIIVADAPLDASTRRYALGRATARPVNADSGPVKMQPLPLIPYQTQLSHTNRKLIYCIY
jgi:hypothetical protein